MSTQPKPHSQPQTVNNPIPPRAGELVASSKPQTTDEECEKYWAFQDEKKAYNSREINPDTGVLETPEEQDNRLEIEHLVTIYDSFSYYASWLFKRISRKERDYHHLPAKMKDILKHMPVKFERMRECVLENQRFISRIVARPVFSDKKAFERAKSKAHKKPSEFNMDKVRSTLKQCVRDWADEGTAEREKCYGPILKELARLFPDASKRHNFRVLNPGCGLGRLTWEIARLGFESQGNEFSYFMLLCSNVIINSLQMNDVVIYPYIDQVTNVWKFEDQARGIRIPNVDPFSVMANRPDNANYSIGAGDFIEVYQDTPNHWDVVASCFFLDTAKNVLKYIEVIARCLKPGGYLINYGPLLYHFDDMPEPSIELTYEELRRALPVYGLKIIKEEFEHTASYTRNDRSMLNMTYHCVFFVAQKQGDGTNQAEDIKS